MSIETLLLVTDAGQARGMAALAASVGTVSAIAVGPRDVADVAASTGCDVTWIELPDRTPVEAHAPAVADLAAKAAPRLLLASRDPAGRALLGAAGMRVGASIIAGVVGLTEVGGDLTVDRAVVGGDSIETLATDGPVAGIFAGEAPTAVAETGVAGVVSQAEVTSGWGIEEINRAAIGASTGVMDATRVVSVGLGVRSEPDLEIARRLAETLGAEIACSMPIADDRGWIEKARYIGRSGQHISPQLYIALGISGAPQHMEGVRGAKVVVAVNNDPDARIFRTADYGIVGDLYEVVPELTAQLSK